MYIHISHKDGNNAPPTFPSEKCHPRSKQTAKTPHDPPHKLVYIAPYEYITITIIAHFRRPTESQTGNKPKRRGGPCEYMLLHLKENDKNQNK